MKAMIFSDLIMMRRSLAQLVVTCIIAVVVIAVGMRTLVPVGAAFAAMVPLMFVFSVAAYDEMNGWESFRLAMPMSRRAVVVGRYAALLAVCVVSLFIGVMAAYLLMGISAAFGAQGDILGAFTLEDNPHEAIWGGAVGGMVMVLLMAAVTLPLVMRSGMTKAVRIAPLAVVVLVLGGMALVGDDGPLAPFASDVVRWLGENAATPLLLVSAVAGVTLALYGASLALSLRFYAKRDL